MDVEETDCEGGVHIAHAFGNQLDDYKKLPSTKAAEYATLPSSLVEIY
jgi:hypothetical protein